MRQYSVRTILKRHLLIINTNSPIIYKYLKSLTSNKLLVSVKTITLSLHVDVNDLTIRDTDKEHIFITFPLSNLKTQEDLFFVVKYFIQKYCSQFDGIFLHGSSILYKGKGYLFLGDSGSGKTTIAQNSDLPVISDDLALLSVHDTEIAIQRSALDIGVNLKMNTMSKIDQEYSLESIFLLKQSGKNFIRPIKLAEKMNILLFNSLLYQGESHATKRNISLKSNSKLRDDFIKKILIIIASTKISKLFFTQKFVFKPENLVKYDEK